MKNVTMIAPICSAPVPGDGFTSTAEPKPMQLTDIAQPAKELIVAAYRDFAIVCFQRSGSHLLATAIDSHPEICCQGELLQAVATPYKPYAPKPIASPGVSGAILMYSQWKLAQGLGIKPRKFIHLLRDPVMTAISIARNEADARARGACHRPHIPRGTTQMQVAEFDKAIVPDWAARIAKQQQVFSRLLAGYPVLEICYEHLTGGKDVEVLPEQASARILQFLGVARTSTLVATIKKSS